ncbi:ParA family protein [Asticcacaulis benevestitus]|nr:ParA family protein [Asticcacaulis benevestitus]
MQTLVLANQKGGVGKSALACQLAYHLARAGKRVLFVDLDHQGNSTKALLGHPKTSPCAFSATHLLEGRGGMAPEAALALIGADSGLSGLERRPSGHNGFVEALRAFLVCATDRYDVCVIDTNPNPDIRYAAAMIAADHVLSPIQLNQEAIDGIGALFNHARYGLGKIKATFNPNLNFMGILPNLVEPTPFQRNNFAQIVRHFPQHLLEIQSMPKLFALIQKRSVIAEAQASGQFVADMRKTAARDTWREIKPVLDLIARKLSKEA